MSDLLDKAQGSLMGLAIGDALGTTVEFSPRGTFKPVKTIVGGGPFQLEAGMWTDDTSMALCLAESLAEKGWDPFDQMNRYVNWWQHGYNSPTGECFDIGNTTRLALQIYNAVGKKAYCGPTQAKQSGNGGIMRLCPVPIFYHSKLLDTVNYSRKSSQTTHGSKLCVDSAGLMGAIIHYGLNGKNKEEMLSPMLGLKEEFLAPVRDKMAPEVREIALGSYKNKKSDSISSSGFVIHSLEAAL